MIEYLFPTAELHTVRPPRMNIGEFIAFKGYNPLGKGQQAVHNSGSSMLKDTPSFKSKVLSFLSEHFIYSDGGNNINLKLYISKQVDLLQKFKTNKLYRNVCLNEIFDDINTLSFSGIIKSEYLYISLIMFFVKEYNFLKSTHQEHSFTKTKALQYYSTENNLIKQYVLQLQKLTSIKYLSDICFGRYYFLEVHFQEKKKPRKVPKQIVYEFLQTQKKHIDDFDLTEQKEIQSVKTLTIEDLSKQNNRKPIIIETSGRKSYKTDPRLAKTVLSKVAYKCEINDNHMTFFTKRGTLFSESHHIIPMSFQEKYLPINIDREENIASLCPTCHRAIHHGNYDEKKTRIHILYKKKIENLKKCGINLSFTELMSFYV